MGPDGSPHRAPREDRPVAVDGQVTIRPMMYLALSYDHRLVDGAQNAEQIEQCDPWPANTRGVAMTVREQETLLQALDLWRKAVGEMTWEVRAEAALALLMVRDDEIEELRRRIQQGEIQ